MTLKMLSLPMTIVMDGDGDQCNYDRHVTCSWYGVGEENKEHDHSKEQSTCMDALHPTKHTLLAHLPTAMDC